MQSIYKIESFEQVWQAIIDLYKQRNSPLRTPTVMTMGGTYPQGRTMVLREVFSFGLIFFTDKRSPKWIQIKDNNHISVHSYVPKDKIQLLFNGCAVLQYAPSVRQRSEAFNRWQDYATVPSPSTVWKGQGAVPITKEFVDENFGVIECLVTSIEILELGNPHRRVVWTKTDTDVGWTRKSIVP